MRNPPKRKKIQLKRLMAAAPNAMKMARKIEGQDDAHQKRELLKLTRHLELGHDDDEDEQVVDREAVFGDPAGKELPRRNAAQR